MIPQPKIKKHQKNHKFIPCHHQNLHLHPQKFYPKNKNLCPERFLNLLMNDYSPKKPQLLVNFTPFVQIQKSGTTPTINSTQKSNCQPLHRKTYFYHHQKKFYNINLKLKPHNINYCTTKKIRLRYILTQSKTTSYIHQLKYP